MCSQHICQLLCRHSTQAKCVELLAGKNGVLQVLEQEAEVPQPSDTKFNSNLHRLHPRNRLFPRPHPKDIKSTFIIKHYASAVVYTVGAFINKNNDALPQDLATLLPTSSSELLRDIFRGTEVDPDAASSSSSRPKKKNKRTVARKFHNQITALMKVLDSTSCNFIQCVKPNKQMKKGLFNRLYVVTQLRALGLISTCEVLRGGLPTRVDYAMIKEQIKPALPKSVLNLFERHGDKRFVAATLSVFNVPIDSYKLGMTKLFFRTGKISVLRDLLDQAKKMGESGADRDVERKMRRWLARYLWRVGYAKVFAQRGFLQLLRRTRSEREVRLASIKVQKYWRMVMAVKQLKFLKAAKARKEEEERKQKAAEEARKRAEEERLRQEAIREEQAALREMQRDEGCDDEEGYDDDSLAPGQKYDRNKAKQGVGARAAAKMAKDAARAAGVSGRDLGDRMGSLPDMMRVDTMNIGEEDRKVMDLVKQRVEQRNAAKSVGGEADDDEDEELDEEAAKKKDKQKELDGLATTLHEIGAVLDAKGNRDGALRYLHHSLKLQKELHGDDAQDPGIATTLHDIGMVLNDKGDCEGALDYLQQSLRMHTNIHGSGAVHSQIAPTLHEIGRVLAHKGDHRGALEYLQRSLDMNKKLHGDLIAHPGIAATLHVIGRVFNAVNKHEKALQYLDQALKMKRQIHGVNAVHSAIAITLHAIGMVLVHKGKNDGALKYLGEALAMKRQIQGADAVDSGIATTMHVMGSVLAHKGDHDSALRYLESALRMKRQIHGKEAVHSGIAATLHVVGRVRRAINDYSGAMQYLQSSLRMKRTIHGAQAVHPGIASTLYEMGAVMNATGEYQEALRHLKQALAMRQALNRRDGNGTSGAQAAPTHDPEVVAIMHEMGIALAKSGDRVQAIQ
jgi:tetratricopeptide (TPR) repeat protein